MIGTSAISVVGQHYYTNTIALREQLIEKISEKYGLKVPLCAYCHTGSEGVHHNRELDLKLMQQCQQAFEEKYSHKMWMQLIRKNYL